MHAGHEDTQRARLIEAMIQLTLSRGYLSVSIAEVIAAAGVSRRTFYEHFAHKDECLLAAVAEIQEALLSDLRGGMAAASPQDALAVAIDALIALAGIDDGSGRLWLIEAVSGGTRLLDARDHTITAIGRMLEERYAIAPRDTPLPDVSARMLVGGVCRLLAWRLQSGEASLGDAREDLIGWTRHYERAVGEHRWRSLQPARIPDGPNLSPPLRPPIAIPREGSRSSRAELEHNQRQRVLFAGAQIAERGGYASATIAEITSLAGIDARAFRRLFATKQDVFAAVHELYFQHVLTVSASAFAIGNSWPEQIWQAGRAFTQLVEQNPALAHISFVEAHAAGADAMRRHQELVVAFTIFLREGFRDLAPGQHPPSPLTLEAIALTNFEIAYRQCREGASMHLSGLISHGAYLTLAPFLGVQGADQFIDQQLGEDPK